MLFTAQKNIGLPFFSVPHLAFSVPHLGEQLRAARVQRHQADATHLLTYVFDDAVCVGVVDVFVRIENGAG